MDKDEKEFLDWMTDKEACNIWDLETTFEDKEEFGKLKKILGAEQAQFLKGLIEHINFAMEFHDGEKSEAHEDIRAKIKKLEARFRNHRHETTKKFSGKAEY